MRLGSPNVLDRCPTARFFFVPNHRITGTRICAANREHQGQRRQRRLQLSALQASTSAEAASATSTGPAGTGAPILGLHSAVARSLALFEAASICCAVYFQAAHLQGAAALTGLPANNDIALTAVVISLLLGLLKRLWRSLRGSGGNALAAERGQLATADAASLAQLERLRATDAASVAALKRELSKLHTRTATLGHQLRPTLQQVQAQSSLQAEAVEKIVSRLEALDKQTQDTRELLAGLQGTIHKLWVLVANSLKK